MAPRKRNSLISRYCAISTWPPANDRQHSAQQLSTAIPKGRAERVKTQLSRLRSPCSRSPRSHAGPKTHSNQILKIVDGVGLSAVTWALRLQLCPTYPLPGRVTRSHSNFKSAVQSSHSCFHNLSDLETRCKIMQLGWLTNLVPPRGNTSHTVLKDLTLCIQAAYCPLPPAHLQNKNYLSPFLHKTT